MNAKEQNLDLILGQAMYSCRKVLGIVQNLDEETLCEPQNQRNLRVAKLHASNIMSQLARIVEGD